jgi:hypothetical protein
VLRQINRFLESELHMVLVGAVLMGVVSAAMLTLDEHRQQLCDSTQNAQDARCLHAHVQSNDSEPPFVL